MRLDIEFEDRVGIAREVLAVLSDRRLNLQAVEVLPPHIYLDVPELQPSGLANIRAVLSGVSGVLAVEPIDILPGKRRELHLSTIVEAMADPVLLLDGRGRVTAGNAAALTACRLTPESLPSASLAQLLGDTTTASRLLEAAFDLPAFEAVVAGKPYLLEPRPAEAGAGGILTLRSPSRMGQQLHALQHLALGGFAAILGESACITDLKKRAARLAAVDAPLLVLGETGTGKELIAQACHEGSKRAGAPFLALNCAALPENLAESELFGYAPGAFSGANRGGKPGLLELADHGTVFLDEVGELSLYMQAKLLRVLNDGSFRRVGGQNERRVDVRIIAATHRDLAAMVKDGRFREDLYYRLNVLHLDVPPLRDRGQDILLLAETFRDRAARQTGSQPDGFTPKACEALLANPWPGNVRQLENVIFRAVTLNDGEAIDTLDLNLEAPSTGAGTYTGSYAGSGSPLGPTTTYAQALEAFEKDLLQTLYPHYPSSRKLATRLGVSHTTVAQKLKRYGVG